MEPRSEWPDVWGRLASIDGYFVVAACPALEAGQQVGVWQGLYSDAPSPDQDTQANAKLVGRQPEPLGECIGGAGEESSRCEGLQDATLRLTIDV